MIDEKIHLFADFTLDLARGSLLRAGEPVHLRPQAYEVLRYLAENRGRLIGKDKLVEIVWQGRAVTDDALVQCLKEVRQALGAEGKLYVRNVRGRGYIFEPNAEGQGNGKAPLTPSEQVEHETGETEVMEQTAPPVAAPAASAGQARSSAENLLSLIDRHRGAALIGLTVLVVAAAAIVYYARLAPRDEAIRSVAVLPFANESGDPQLEYLSDGLSESLIDQLSQLPGLKVIARSSSFKYKGRQVDPQEAAQALGVEALVTGRVVQRGDDLQVRAELVDARAGAQIWGQQYNRRAADLQAVQEEIMHAISEKLQLRLSRAQEQQLAKHLTPNPQAYQFYLNGLFNSRRSGLESARKALDYYHRALALDPNFALALVGVANTHILFANNNYLDPREALLKGKAAVQKALELDQTLPEAHIALAQINFDEWDWAGAEREFRRAIELSPNLVDSHRWFSSYLSVMGRHAEALSEIKRAQELDPLQDELRRLEGMTLLLARRNDEALEKLLSNKRNHRGLGLAYEAKGMYEQAIKEYQQAISIYGRMIWDQISLGYALAMSGKRSEAQAILDQLQTTEEFVSPAELAILSVGLGDKEGAIAALETAYKEHDLQLKYLNVDPHYDSLRSDPRFQALVRRIGLPQ